MASFKLAGQFQLRTYLDTRINIYAYRVVRGDEVLLIDMGIGDVGNHIETRFEPQRTSISDQLARFNLVAADVNLVANSHLHFDHCGNNKLFPNAEIFVHEEELATARALKDRYTVPWWFDYEGARIHPVCGDMEISPGIRLLATPGHTPGHQSVLVESGTARLLVAAQAAFTADEYHRGGEPSEQAQEGLAERYVESIARLKSLKADRVYFSHDARVVTESGIEE